MMIIVTTIQFGIRVERGTSSAYKSEKRAVAGGLKEDLGEKLVLSRRSSRIAFLIPCPPYATPLQRRRHLFFFLENVSRKNPRRIHRVEFLFLFYENTATTEANPVYGIRETSTFSGGRPRDIFN